MLLLKGVRGAGRRGNRLTTPTEEQAPLSWRRLEQPLLQFEGKFIRPLKTTPYEFYTHLKQVSKRESLCQYETIACRVGSHPVDVLLTKLLWTAKFMQKMLAETAPLPGMTSTDPENVRFVDLDLSETMIKALNRAGYETPTPVQAGMIPMALDGLDIIGQARTGTGKTAAFAIPIIESLEPRRRCPNPQALILVPTRELAVQVTDEVEKLSFGRKCESVAIYGGKPIRRQIEKLQRGPQIVVGTPGRVLDHIYRGTLILKDIWGVVLDEADRMLDIGFRPDIEKILRRCPAERQTMLLSATLPPPILRLAERYMFEAEQLNFSTSDLTVDTIEQFYFTVEHERKFELLVRLLEREQPQQAIVFCRTKRGTEQIFRKLAKQLKSAGCIHGDMQQNARDKVMSSFRKSELRYLVATDVVGRGIDVSGISHIINYDTPKFCDDYVHRVGRTGRMGRDGVAYTFVAPEEGNELTRIEQRINRQLVRGEMEGFEQVSARPEANGEPLEKKAPPASMMRRPPKRYRRGL